MSAPGYEKSDVTIRGVVVFATTLAVATAALMGLMFWMYWDLEDRAVETDAASVPRTRLSGAIPDGPPRPILQGSPGSNFELQAPYIEMDAWDEIMDEQLATSAWVDRNAGIVRIPIQDAKVLLLERGLPVRQPPAEPLSEPLSEVDR